jgi:hypothetical protein
MSGLSRRSFLGRSSIAVAVGGAATAVPGLSSILQIGESDSGEVGGGLTEAEMAATDASPVVAHVTDLQAGEIRLYQGERMVTYRDPGLAARLIRAAR